MADINDAIEVYSHAFGNRIEPLRALCASNDGAEALATEIRELQESILELVRLQSGPDGLPQAQIVQLARQHLADRKPAVNEVGFHGLMRYVIWVAWHDGWLHRE